jgi:hypothetical protein
MTALFQECLRSNMSTKAVSKMYQSVFLTHVGDGIEVIDDDANDNNENGDAGANIEKNPVKWQKIDRSMILDTKKDPESIIHEMFNEEYYKVSGKSFKLQNIYISHRIYYLLSIILSANSGRNRNRFKT